MGAPSLSRVCECPPRPQISRYRYARPGPARCTGTRTSTRRKNLRLTGRLIICTPSRRVGVEVLLKLWSLSSFSPKNVKEQGVFPFGGYSTQHRSEDRDRPAGGANQLGSAVLSPHMPCALLGYLWPRPHQASSCRTGVFTASASDAAAIMHRFSAVSPLWRYTAFPPGAARVRVIWCNVQSRDQSTSRHFPIHDVNGTPVAAFLVQSSISLSLSDCRRALDGVFFVALQQLAAHTVFANMKGECHECDRSEIQGWCARTFILPARDDYLFKVGAARRAQRSFALDRDLYQRLGALAASVTQPWC
ncbi:Hypothetical predicted protein [Olea europaea subsp. europaea]|uniref:Uncharacterized protein n=1 Tax=Olea europaea subsp. europaea TaxID=158383 RepID=A0A8S0UEQ1_OLEEU|nr:Hypothetical predicted protein [Olea europaea subsp. europaea]